MAAARCDFFVQIAPFVSTRNHDLTHSLTRSLVSIVLYKYMSVFAIRQLLCPTNMQNDRPTI